MIRFLPKKSLIAGFLSISSLFSQAAFAQDSPESPLFLSEPRVSSSYAGSGQPTYYYSFWANAGRHEIEVEAIGVNPGCNFAVRVHLRDLERLNISGQRQGYGSGFDLACNPSNGPTRFMVTIPERRPILMVVAVGVNAGPSVVAQGSYSINLGGSFSPTGAPPSCSTVSLANVSGRPWVRFTGRTRSADVPLAITTNLSNLMPSSLQLSISTGGDDLRRGSIAYAEVGLLNGSSLPRVNLNEGASWQNGTTRTIPVSIPPQTRLGSIRSITLIHDGEPRSFPDTYDNWNVDAVSIRAPQSCAR